MLTFLKISAELGAGTRGSSLGPAAIEIASVNTGNFLFDHYPVVAVRQDNKALYTSFGSPYAKRIQDILKVNEQTHTKVKDILENERFPLVLSGDHSNATGTIAGVKAAYPKERLGVIWIDAHTDLHSPYTTPSGNVHGMPVAAGLAIDNKSYQVNNLDKKTIKQWEQLKQIGQVSPKFAPEDLVFLCVRDTEPQEEAIIQENKINNYSVDDLRHTSIEKMAQNVLKELSDCDRIYISFDVDAMDPSVSRGTGTPAPNGISDKEAGRLLNRLVEDKRVCCLEITEVNPLLDHENSMAERTFNVIQKVVAELKHR